MLSVIFGGSLQDLAECCGAHVVMMYSSRVSPSAVQVSVFVVTIGISVFSLWWLLGKRKRNYIHVGKVSKLLFFPVKSIGGIEVSSLDCVEKGAQVDGCDDRCYMLISGDGFICSQRVEPSMVLLKPSICGNKLHISGPEMDDTLVLDLKPSFSSNDKMISCRIFTEEAPAYDCGDEASAWFQKYLKRPDVRLVYTAEGKKKRKVIRDNKFTKKIREKTAISFQDFAPFHVLSQKSIDDLNSNLKETQISVNNFRPNILIDGCNAFDEDKWQYVKFSSGAEICHLVPCGRCVLTTNNPETGIKTDKDPLVTLRTYRQPKNEFLRANYGTAPLFGVYFKLVKQGKVAVGDDVFAVVEPKDFKY